MITAARIPLATYRLQFNSRFTFRNATAIVNYLRDLGVTDCYASSYLKAVPGSPHGYDVADPTRLNPDLGSDEDYWAWIDGLHASGMGHVLDLVPNHMGIAKSSNPWWQDVLENGPSSRFARFFDIEWRPVKDELADKVLIPILGDQYGAVLERHELQLVYRDGSFAVGYYNVSLPLAPDTYPTILGLDLEGLGARTTPETIDELHSIITASLNLAPRTTRDPEQIAIRAREKEVVKRRLARLAEENTAVRDYIESSVAQFNGCLGHPRSFDLLDRLLNEQSYRLAHWRVASEEINYRRFFDVNELAALRMEDPEVFEEVHRFVFELIRQGAATGLRVDHVDGLYAPADYLCRLQRRAAEVRGLRDASPDAIPAESRCDPFNRPMFVVVEKILGADEQLPSEWPVNGTTGYEFASVINNLFVDRRSERAFTEIYARFVRERQEQLSFADLAYRSKKQIMHETMSGDINSLGHQLNRFSERNRHFRDFTLYSLISTIKEVIACFPVYRTYVTGDQSVSDHDRRYIIEAVRNAKRRSPGITSLLFDFIERVLLKQTPGTAPDECRERAEFIGKFQQITSPISAKGIEDTALYVYNRLLSLNEVGNDPTRFGIEPDLVHGWLAERQRRWPTGLSVLSTHDTKRGEDARARLNVLSEIPGAWKAALAKWRGLNRRHKTDVRGVTAPDPNEEYFIYQTLLAAWPFDRSAAGESDFRQRLAAYLIKALREAKVHTSWLSPDETYEAAVVRFAEHLIDFRRHNLFLQAFLPFQARIAELGIYNSLSQQLIKITAPGIPDFYQGSELWDLSLVDPDNRRPVDYETRVAALADLRAQFNASPARDALHQLLDQRSDGRIKLFTISTALAARARVRDLFERGGYFPLQTSGNRRDAVFGFARCHEGHLALTCVPRLIASLAPDAGAPPLGRAIWSDTTLALPPDLLAAVGRGRPLPARAPLRFRNAFTGSTIEAQETDGRVTVQAAAVFESFPIALLLSA